MKDYESKVIQQQQQPQFEMCNANDCYCKASFEGLCTWHSLLQDSHAFPKMTSIIKRKDFRNIVWYINRLMPYYIPQVFCWTDSRGIEHVMSHSDCAKLLRKALIDFGLEPDVVKFYEDDRPKSYAYRMQKALENHLVQMCQPHIHDIAEAVEQKRLNGLKALNETLEHLRRVQ